MNTVTRNYLNEISNATKHDGIHNCIYKIGWIDSDDRVLNDNVILKEYFGSGSVNGEARKTIIKLPGNIEMPAATKIMPLKPYEIDDIEVSLDYKSPEQIIKQPSAVEIISMRLCRFIYDMKMTPNVPLGYNLTICKNCTYRNVDLQQSVVNGHMTNKCIYFVNELADEIDLKTWLSKQQRTFLEIKVMYFQICTALYALQKFFDLTHHDLHWGNVLVHKIPSPAEGGRTHFVYEIDGIPYKIPNIGYLFTLWDFGYALIPRKMQAQDTRYYTEYNPSHVNLYSVDYHRLILVTVQASIEHGFITDTNIINDLKTLLEYITRNHFMKGHPLIYMFKDIFNDFKSNIPLTSDYSIQDIIPLEFSQQLGIYSKRFINSNNDYLIKTRNLIITDVERYANQIIKLQHNRDAFVPKKILIRDRPSPFAKSTYAIEKRKRDLERLKLKQLLEQKEAEQKEAEQKEIRKNKSKRKEPSPKNLKQHRYKPY